MSFLGTRNAVAIGVSQHLTLGGPDLLSKLSPSLILQFAGAQTMDPRITFTRSTTATFTGSNGLLQTAAINAPRFDYDPVTLAPLGLLIEEQRTNLVTYSEQFDNAAWTKTNATITANTIVAPDGTLTGDKLVANTTGGTTHSVSQNLSTTSGVSYTQTVYAKSAEQISFSIQLQPSSFGATVTASFNLSAQTVTVAVNGTATSATITPVGNGWFRCSLTSQATATATTPAGILAEGAPNTRIFAGNDFNGIYIWGAQLEAGAFPTSYIPTVASQVTRAADVAVMTGTNFSSWYNQAEGTLYVEAALVSNSGNRVYLDVGPNGAFGTTAYIVQTSSAISLAPAAAPVNMASSVNTTSLNNKVAAALETNNSLVAANGALGTVDTNCAMPVSATQLVIGNAVWSGGGAQLNGYISRIAYYSRRLSNAALQGITS